MTSPRNIYPVSQPQHCRHEDDHLSYGRSTRLDSASYESNRTDLSLNSRDVIVADQWVVLGKIGEGSFGEVFEVRDINTKRHYAIKRETMKIKLPQLKFENVMYDVLAGGVGIPQCHWYGQFDGFDCIVMDLLGPNLNQVRQNVSCMELDIAVDLVCQMVSIIEHIHNRGVIVRDVKPDNFLFPSNCFLPEMEMIESMDDYGMPLTTYRKSTCRQVFEEQWGESYPRLYAVDFGLACYWRDPETGVPYPDTKKHNRSKTGTARYASINVHRGKSHSRRDDVESIGYILLDLLLGTLPWTGIHARNSKAGWDRMRQLKVDTFMADLCAGLPLGVLKFVEYPRTLQFVDQPDYELMRHFLKECLPGGAYSKVVKSPFGGEAQPTDNYNVIQQELEELQEKQKLKAQQQQQHHRQPLKDSNGNKKVQDHNDHHTDLFAMDDDLTNQLSMAAISESKPARQLRKNSTASQSSLHKLLKRNRAKKVGWNTHKHDQAPWNPKTDWSNEEKSTENLAKSWGDDNQHTMGSWGLAPSAELKNSRKTDDNDDLDLDWGKDHQTLRVRSDEGNDRRQQQQHTTDTAALSHRHGEPSQSTVMMWDSSGASYYQNNHSQQKKHPYTNEVPTYRQRHHSQPHHQQHHHRRYPNPSNPAAAQPSIQNTNDRRRSYGVEDDKPFQNQPHQPHQRQNRSTTNAFSYHRRPSNHRNNNNNNNNNILQEATSVDGRTRKNGSTISWQEKESPGAK